MKDTFKDVTWQDLFFAVTIGLGVAVFGTALAFCFGG